MDMVTVTATAEHGNSHGDSYAKAVGDHYACPVEEAQRLARDGLVSLPDGAADAAASAPAPATGKGKRG